MLPSRVNEVFSTCFHSVLIVGLLKAVLCFVLSQEFNPKWYWFRNCVDMVLTRFASISLELDFTLALHLRNTVFKNIVNIFLCYLTVQM